MWYRRHAALASAPLAALVVLATPDLAAACKCAAPRADVTTAIAEADLVVEARVDAHEFVREIGFRTRLTVSRTHKGVPSRPLLVTAAKTCAVGFEPGTRYLVYASRDGDGGFTTTYCSRTAPLAQAGADLAVLARAPGAAPREPAPDTAVWPGLAAWIAWVAASSVEIAIDR